MRFTKMHGAGNDFIIIDIMRENIPPASLPALARKLCAAHTSLGADGLMAVTAAKNGGDYAMLSYNADGSLGEMCGNGARCVARYGFEKGLAGEIQRIETTAGLVTGRRLSKRIYQVCLNRPEIIDLHRAAPALGRDHDCAYIELGAPGLPHAVLLLDEGAPFDRESLRALGKALRFSPAFPKGANVNFVKKLGDSAIKVLTYERGVEDFTLACGTGCGSSALALSMLGHLSGKEIRVLTDGGELRVAPEPSALFLSGPTNLVCEGEILDEDLEIQP